MTHPDRFIASRHKEVPIQNKERINQAYYKYIIEGASVRIPRIIITRVVHALSGEKSQWRMTEKYGFIHTLDRQIKKVQCRIPSGTAEIDDFFSDTLTARLVLEGFRNDTKKIDTSADIQQKFYNALLEFIAETDSIRGQVVKIIERHRSEGIDIDIEHIARQETRRIFDVAAEADVSRIPRIIAVYLNEIVQGPYDIARKIRILSAAEFEMQYLIGAVKNKKLIPILRYFIEYIWKKQLLLEKKIIEMEDAGGKE